MAGIRLGDLADLYQRATSAVFGDGPSVSQQLGAAFPQPFDAGKPGMSVAQAAPAPTTLTPEQMNLVGGLTSVGGIMAGEGAATANLGALAKAKGMAEAGHDAPSIWGQTGWFKGPEGRWKFEIDDSGARVLDTPEALDAAVKASLDAKHGGLPTAAGLDEVFSHPELSRAYFPTRESAPSVFYDNLGRTRGNFRAGPDGGEVTLNSALALDPKGERSTMLHELQHAVQEREGFERGGSANSAANVIGMTADPAVLEQARTIQHLGRQMGGLDDYLKDFPAALPDGTPYHDAALYFARNPERLAAETNKTFLKANPGEAYRRLAGEAEARAVQARADLTPEQRRAAFPLDSYDVPLDQLIMRGIQVGR